MEKKKINGVLILTLVGLIIAAGAFLITFITTQKADEPEKNYDNLKIAKQIIIPTPPTLPPLKGTLISTQSALPVNIPIESPISSLSSQSAEISTPSASVSP